ncbi:hypothetical protein KEM56_007138 [Ascosphaera pollenicola]|nr:hypothetical protein KEM56_007138 [Ascosphaera pollenicola]
MVRALLSSRVKDARSEAQKEIDAYRQQKEEEFRKFEAEHSSGFKAAEEEANQDAEVKLREIKEAGAKNGPRVVENLVQTTTNVDAKVPEKLARA